MIESGNFESAMQISLVKAIKYWMESPNAIPKAAKQWKSNAKLAIEMCSDDAPAQPSYKSKEVTTGEMWVSLWRHPEMEVEKWEVVQHHSKKLVEWWFLLRCPVCGAETNIRVRVPLQETFMAPTAMVTTLTALLLSVEREYAQWVLHHKPHGPVVTELDFKSALPPGQWTNVANLSGVQLIANYGSPAPSMSNKKSALKELGDHFAQVFSQAVSPPEEVPEVQDSGVKPSVGEDPDPEPLKNGKTLEESKKPAQAFAKSLVKQLGSASDASSVVFESLGGAMQSFQNLSGILKNHKMSSVNELLATSNLHNVTILVQAKCEGFASVAYLQIRWINTMTGKLLKARTVYSDEDEFQSLCGSHEVPDYLLGEYLSSQALFSNSQGQKPGSKWKAGTEYAFDPEGSWALPDKVTMGVDLSAQAADLKAEALVKQVGDQMVQKLKALNLHEVESSASKLAKFSALYGATNTGKSDISFDEVDQASLKLDSLKLDGLSLSPGQKLLVNGMPYVVMDSANNLQLLDVEAGPDYNDLVYSPWPAFEDKIPPPTGNGPLAFKKGKKGKQPKW